MENPDFWTAVASVTIALLTVGLFVLQWRQHAHDKKVANANHRLALHDKRLEVIIAVEEFLSDFYKTGEPDMYKASTMMFRLRDADLLFPEEALTSIKEFRSQAGKFYVLKQRVEHLQKTEMSGSVVYSVADGPPSDEELAKRREIASAEISDKRDEMHEISTWILAQSEGQRDDMKWLKPLREQMKFPPRL